MSAADDAQAVAGPDAGPARPAGRPAEPVAPSFDATLGERVSDRLNPILVRELLQALNGRAFLATLTLSLFAIVLVALASTSDADTTRPTGGRAFVLALQALTPVLLFLLPFRAFLSMRQEVLPGTLEHLLLSRLTPGRIVRGKLYAGCVEFGLFLSVFAPLLALTYLLRGVDIPTIALVVALAFVAAFGATSLAVAMGALSRWPAGRAIPLILLALGLAVTTIAVVGGMREFVWAIRLLPQSADATQTLIALLIPVLLGSLLLALVACAALAHPYENRSTSFRGFALFCFLLGIAWAVYYVLDLSPRGSFFRFQLRDVVPIYVAITALPLAPFWIFAVTEEEAFSPRTRTTVPRRRVLALLAAPLLPGGGRGMLYTMVLAAVALTGAWFVPQWFEGGLPSPKRWRTVLGAWAYVLVFAGLVGFVRRHWLPAGPRGSIIARVGAPFLLLVFTLIPVIAALLGGRPERRWIPLHVLSPASTIEELSRSSSDPLALPLLLASAAIVVLLQLPAVVRGLRETLQASRARETRAP